MGGGAEATVDSPRKNPLVLIAAQSYNPRLQIIREEEVPATKVKLWGRRDAKFDAPSILGIVAAG